MPKIIKEKNRGAFALKFRNNKVLKFRTREAYATACEALSRGIFYSTAEMYSRAKQVPAGFEYVALEKKAEKVAERFNEIEFDD